MILKTFDKHAYQGPLSQYLSQHKFNKWSMLLSIDFKGGLKFYLIKFFHYNDRNSIHMDVKDAEVDLNN